MADATLRAMDSGGIPDSDADADDRLGGHLAAGWAAYRAADLVAGLREARAAVALAPRHGEAWYVLAVHLERSGRTGQADRCFVRAARAPVDPQDPPYRIPFARFRVLADAAAADLPPRLRAGLDEVSLVLTDYAEPGLLEGMDDVELLGLFTGTPRPELSPGADFPGLTPSIHLFRRAHEHHCGSRAEMAAEVRRTLFHEFGHYLGYDEDDLTAMGLE